MTLDDLHEDREAASGKGVRASHLATWTAFHLRAAVSDSYTHAHTTRNAESLPSLMAMAPKISRFKELLFFRTPAHNEWGLFFLAKCFQTTLGSSGQTWSLLTPQSVKTETFEFVCLNKSFSYEIGLLVFAPLLLELLRLSRSGKAP